MTPEPAVSPYEFAQIESSLEVRGDNSSLVELAWLHHSWVAPDVFWSALKIYWERVSGGTGKSQPQGKFDFHQDILVRQQHNPFPAFAGYDPVRGWNKLGYADLTESVERLSAAWQAAGVQSGDVVAIVYPLSTLWLIALLAALQLGMVVSILPPLGRAFVSRRLHALKARWLAADRFYVRALSGDWLHQVLPDSGGNTRLARGYNYAFGETVALLFDPVSATPDVPRPVPAESLYRGAMRDGVLALGLKMGQSCAAPGWHTLETQPSLMLSVLMSGGTYVHLELADIETHTARLEEQPVDILLISLKLRDILQKKPISGIKSCKHWFRHPGESMDMVAWNDFMERQSLQNITTGNMVWNSALGGCILFSVRFKVPHTEVLPAPASRWLLGDLRLPLQPTQTNTGYLVLSATSNENPPDWVATTYLLARNRGVWTYLGAYPRGRSGRTYPRNEVLDVISEILDYGMMVEAVGSIDNEDPPQVLLVFAQDVPEYAVRDRIQLELGNDFQPDRIEFLPYLPKLDGKGKPDALWCQTLFSIGELYRRKNHPLFQCLSELKKLILIN